MTTRRSQNIDLYRDLMKVETPQTKAVDIDMGFENVFMAKTDGTLVRISTSNERFSYSLNEEVTKSTSTNTTFRRCIDHLNLFQGVLNINEILFIAHGCIFSIYSIQEKRWLNHYLQEADIHQVFRLEDEDHMIVGIVLINGVVKLLETHDSIYYRKWDFI